MIFLFFQHLINFLKLRTFFFYFSILQLSGKDKQYQLDGTASGESGLHYSNVRTDLGSPFATFHTLGDGNKYCDVLNTYNGNIKEGSG